MKKLKYKNEINEFNDCPPEDCTEQSREVYRFIRDVISEESFLPVGIQNPSRQLNNSEKCKAYGGLSLFKDEASALKIYKALCRRNRRPVKTLKSLGNKLAKGFLSPPHGLSSPSNNSGHITFYEYENTNIQEVFSIIGDLSC